MLLRKACSASAASIFFANVERVSIIFKPRNPSVGELIRDMTVPHCFGYGGCELSGDPLAIKAVVESRSMTFRTYGGSIIEYLQAEEIGSGAYGRCGITPAPPAPITASCMTSRFLLLLQSTCCSLVTLFPGVNCNAATPFALTRRIISLFPPGRCSSSPPAQGVSLPSVSGHRGRLP